MLFYLNRLTIINYYLQILFTQSKFFIPYITTKLLFETANMAFEVIVNKIDVEKLPCVKICYSSQKTLKASYRYILHGLLTRLQYWFSQQNILSCKQQSETVFEDSTFEQIVSKCFDSCYKYNFAFCLISWFFVENQFLILTLYDIQYQLTAILHISK